MTFLINHQSILFDKEEAKRIFDDNEKYLNCPYSFDEMINNDWFFLALNKLGKSVGICYILCEQIEKEELPFYSGAFDRKSHEDVKEAHKILLSLAFKHYKRVYTWTPYRHAQIFNLKVGMIRDKENKNVFYKDRS